MHKIGAIVYLTTIWWIEIVSTNTTISPDYKLINDNYGSPRLVIKNDQETGSFWLHLTSIIGNSRSDRISVASIEAYGLVKACVIEVNSTNFNISDWHYFKWILRKNEFSCLLINNEHGPNLTSAPIILRANSSANKTTTNTSDTTSIPKQSTYVISPGAGNSDFCLLNVTIGDNRVLECIRVKKTNPVSGTTNTTCDCPSKPLIASRTFESNSIVSSSNSGNAIGDETRHEFDTNHVTDDTERWQNSSSWLSNFPTPKPFDGSSDRATTVSVITTNSRWSAETKSISRTLITASSGNATTPGLNGSSIKNQITTTPTTKNRCLENGKCRNGICVENTTTLEYYCNCTRGYEGEFCESESNDTEHESNGTGHVIGQDTKCPDDYCQNGGTCASRVLSSAGFGNTTGSNFTCYCREEYLGERCTQTNPCYSTNNPCRNGAACSIIVPINRTESSDRSLYRCLCIDGYEGRDCEIRSSISSPPPAIDDTTRRTVWTNGTTKFGECSELEKAKCRNGATCQHREEKIFCNCTTNFTGEYCETEIGNKEASEASSGGTSNNVGAIVGGVFGALALIGLIIGSVFLYRYVQRSRKLKGKYNPAKEEMTASAGNTLSMTAIPTGERLI